MTITLNGTTGITTPDISTTAQSTDITTTGDISAVDLTASGGVYLGGTVAANYLDDYEEGTFTPSFTTGTFTYATQIGIYTKIGNIVSAQLYLGTNSATGSGTVTISGLPFASSIRTVGSIAADSYVNVPYSARVEASTTVVDLYKSYNGTSPLQVSDFQNFSGGYNQTYINITYRIS